MKCKKCGAENFDGANFCHKCGTKITNANKTTKKKSILPNMALISALQHTFSKMKTE